MPDNPQQPTQPTTNKTSALHTYAGDMAAMVRDNEGSVIKIALAEQKRREADAMKVEAVKKKTINFWLVIGSLVFIVAAFYAVRFFEQKAKEDSIHEEILTKIPTLISDDSQSLVASDTFSGVESIAQALSKEQATVGQAGSVHATLFTRGEGVAKVLIPSREFLALLQSSIPDQFKSTLDPAYMVGTYTASDNSAHTFLILKTTGYDTAYSGSLAWEKTLLSEFFPIFHIDVSGTNADLLQKPWDDMILQNRNVRVLQSSDSMTPLLYSLWLDRRYYMLTDNPEAITEILGRLHTMDNSTL